MFLCFKKVTKSRVLICNHSKLILIWLNTVIDRFSGIYAETLPQHYPAWCFIVRRSLVRWEFLLILGDGAHTNAHACTRSSILVPSTEQPSRSFTRWSSFSGLWIGYVCSSVRSLLRFDHVCGAAVCGCNLQPNVGVRTEVRRGASESSIRVCAASCAITAHHSRFWRRHFKCFALRCCVYRRSFWRYPPVKVWDYTQNLFPSVHSVHCSKKDTQRVILNTVFNLDF